MSRPCSKRFEFKLVIMYSSILSVDGEWGWGIGIQRIQVKILQHVIHIVVFL